MKLKKKQPTDSTDILKPKNQPQNMSLDSVKLSGIHKQKSYAVPETDSEWPLKIGRAPKGNVFIFQPSIFRGELLVFGGVTLKPQIGGVCFSVIYSWVAVMVISTKGFE